MSFSAEPLIATMPLKLRPDKAFPAVSVSPDARNTLKVWPAFHGAWGTKVAIVFVLSTWIVPATNTLKLLSAV